MYMVFSCRYWYVCGYIHKLIAIHPIYPDTYIQCKYKVCTFAISATYIQYTYICTYIHMYIHAFAITATYIHTYSIHIYVHTCIHALLGFCHISYIHTYIHTYSTHIYCMYIHTYIHTCIHALLFIRTVSQIWHSFVDSPGQERSSAGVMQRCRNALLLRILCFMRSTNCATNLDCIV